VYFGLDAGANTKASAAATTVSIATDNRKLSALALIALVTWLTPSDSQAGAIPPMAFTRLIRMMDASVPNQLSDKHVWNKIDRLWQSVRRMNAGSRRQALLTKYKHSWSFEAPQLGRPRKALAVTQVDKPTVLHSLLLLLCPDQFCANS
jgi:hypothetical protein